jgi:hypothetical protein
MMRKQRIDYATAGFLTMTKKLRNLWNKLYKLVTTGQKTKKSKNSLRGNYTTELYKESERYVSIRGRFFRIKFDAEH